MVAAFIFAIGVLGLASLQTRAMQTTFDTSQRAQVVWLSQDLIDRIRINPAAIARYTSLLSSFTATSCTTPTPKCDFSASTSCSPAQMATFDVWDIYCRNQYQGTQATNALQIDLTGTQNLTLKTTWCARAANADCTDPMAQMTHSLTFIP
ncbi:MAG: type IV pilus modification protein PilV [Cellvibrionales bacterium]|nr:type IV pilus modification protein PilV [Cellvibrionales bacterium]